MPGPEGLSPEPQGPQEPKHEGFFAKLFKRDHTGSGVVGLDPGAQAELEAARQPQVSPPEAVATPPVEAAPAPTRAEELAASADARGWAGNSDPEKFGPMPGTPQTPEATAPTTPTAVPDEEPEELPKAA